jgi:hypothetical protein
MVYRTIEAFVTGMKHGSGNGDATTAWRAEKDGRSRYRGTSRRQGHA